jgi:nicotinamide mononucleotide (NMN) deamidase PncC
MAVGARRALGSDLGLAVTGVAGPTPQDGVQVGTVWCGIAGPGASVDVLRMQLPGDRERIRQFSAISVLDVLRRRMLEPAPA